MKKLLTAALILSTTLSQASEVDEYSKNYDLCIKSSVISEFIMTSRQFENLTMKEMLNKHSLNIFKFIAEDAYSKDKETSKELKDKAVRNFKTAHEDRCEERFKNKTQGNSKQSNKKEPHPFDSDLYGTKILTSEGDLWVGSITDTFTDEKTCFISTNKAANVMYWFADKEYVIFPPYESYSRSLNVSTLKLRFDKNEMLSLTNNGLNYFFEEHKGDFKTSDSLIFENKYSENYRMITSKEKVDLTSFNDMYKIASECTDIDYKGSVELKNITSKSIDNIKKDFETLKKQKRQDDIDNKKALDRSFRYSPEGIGADKKHSENIYKKVNNKWIKPFHAKSGWSCSLEINQDENGRVKNIKGLDCNPNNKELRNSVQKAVMQASPLPLPEDMRIWNKTLIFKFSIE